MLPLPLKFMVKMGLESSTLISLGELKILLCRAVKNLKLTTDDNKCLRLAASSFGQNLLFLCRVFNTYLSIGG